MKKWLLLVFLISVSELVWAQEENNANPELEADRPGKGDAATVVPKGAFQAEIGLDLETDGDNISKDREFHLPEVLLRYGILKFAEIRVHAELSHHRFNFVEFPYHRDLTNTEVADIAIGTKLQILQNQGLKPALALQADFKLPVGNSVYEKERIEPKIGLNFKNKLTENLDLQYTVAVEWEEQHSNWDPEKYTHLGHYAVSVNYKVTPKLLVFTEFFGELEEQRSHYSADGGLAYLVLPNLQLDASAGFGLTERAPDFFISTGVSFRLPK